MEQPEPLKVVKEILQAVCALEEWNVEAVREDFEIAKAEYEKFDSKRIAPPLDIYLRYCYANGKLKKAEKLYPDLEKDFEKLKAEYGVQLPPKFWNVKDLLFIESLLRDRKITSLKEGENYLNNK